MENNNTPKKGLKKGVFIGVWSGVFALVLALLIALTCVATHYDSVLTQFMKSVGGGTSGGDGVTDSQYYKIDYADADALKAKEDEFCLEMGREAIVMLENDDCLPLKAGAKVSVFGMAGASGASIGTGSGAAAGGGASLASSLKASGFDVNEPLMEHYSKNSKAHGGGTAAGGGADKGDWSLGKEADFNGSLIGGYTDAAIMVFHRNGGEGGDLARTMDNHGGSADDSYLSLSPSEKATLQAIKDSGKFTKIIALVNSANAMELGELKSYGVNGVLWYGGLGSTGLKAVGEVLAGTVNPSGRLVDTYVYDNFSSPAMQNFGDFRFSDVEQSYVNYAEGIYVGYKYYETRYEDKVTERANVGSYDYDSTVLYPFGFGLSYTNFTYSDFSCKVENDTVKLSVKVTNSGTVAGKETVQIYYGGEYTAFDETNGIEKSAVNLVEFGKTGLIQPTKDETVTVEFPLSGMKVYDEKANKTYILEAGDYYITAAKNAHDAANNILKAKGYDVSGNASLAFKHTVATTVKCDEAANGKVGNLFDGIKLDGAKYLSRSDWSAMDGESATASHVLGAGGITSATGEAAGKSNTMGKSGYVGTVSASARIKAELAKTGYEASGNPKDKNTYKANRTYNTPAELELVDMRGLDYDDPKWETFLNQMKFSEIYELFGHAGYGTIEIKSINKPKTTELDGPTGINSFINNTRGYSFPNEISMAATFNKELVRKEGELVGNDAILMSTGADRMSGWYAPAVNIHRTPFSGRNYEYYSEDAILSGKLVAEVIKGVQSKGMYVYLKHYALNDQETNRAENGNVATFATEQTAREIYLKPFEYGVVEGGARGIMTSMNRIGVTVVAGCYALNTALLRDEWGFTGSVITDYTGSPSPEFSDQVLASGGDLIMCSGWNSQKGVLTDFNAEWARATLRTAAHNTLYVQANSLAMNGFVHGTVYDAGFAVYKIVLIVLWIVLAGGMAATGFWVYRTIPWSAEQWETRKRISKKGWIIIGSVAGAVLITLVIVFCVCALPALMKALVQ